MGKPERTTLKSQIGQVKAWESRRRDKGIEPNADELWAYINKSWPTMHEMAKELIFQEAGTPLKHRGTK